MSTDITDIEGFYGAGPGQLVAGYIRDELAHLSRFWGAAVPVHADRLAVGFPFVLLAGQPLPPVLMPAETGALAWPSETGIIAAAIDSAAWPVASESADGLLVVHALEHVRDQQGFLQECWRALAGSGELIMIVPHRRGLWARADKTPFGQGRPFSRRQIIRQLGHAGFAVEKTRQALFLPPVCLRLPAGLQGKIDRAGRWLWPVFGGILIIRATKKLYSAHPQAHPALRHRLRQFIVRQPAGALSPKERHE